MENLTENQEQLHTGKKRQREKDIKLLFKSRTEFVKFP